MARNRYVEDDNGREVSLAGLAREHARGYHELDDVAAELDVDLADDEDAKSPDYRPVDYSARVHDVRPQQQIHQSPAAQKHTTRY